MEIDTVDKNLGWRVGKEPTTQEGYNGLIYKKEMMSIFTIAHFCETLGGTKK